MSFADPLSDKDLYFIGYIQADGCITRQLSKTKGSNKVYRYLRFSQKYEKPVKELHAHLGLMTKIYFVKSQSTFGYQETYSINSKIGCDALLELGIKNKLREDIYLNFHFWRGMVDGDGSIITDGRNIPWLKLCGNLYDIEKFVEFTDSLGLRKPKIQFQRNCYYVAHTGKNAVILIKHLYLNQYSVLDYKREKAEKIIEKWT